MLLDRDAKLKQPEHFVISMVLLGASLECFQENKEARGKIVCSTESWWCQTRERNEEWVVVAGSCQVQQNQYYYYKYNRGRGMEIAESVLNIMD